MGMFPDVSLGHSFREAQPGCSRPALRFQHTELEALLTLCTTPDAVSVWLRLWSSFEVIPFAGLSPLSFSQRSLLISLRFRASSSEQPVGSPSPGTARRRAATPGTSNVIRTLTRDFHPDSNLCFGSNPVGGICRRFPDNSPASFITAHESWVFLGRPFPGRQYAFGRMSGFGLKEAITPTSPNRTWRANLLAPRSK